MSWCLNRGNCAATVNKKLRHVQTILRFAHKRGAIDAVPDVAELPEDENIPKAFLVDEVARIFEASESLKGSIAGLPARLWWRSLLAACYDTGARIGVLLSIPTTGIDEESTALVLPAKTQKNHRGQLLKLHPDTIALCNSLIKVEPDRDLLWPWPFGRRVVYKHFHRILDRAEVPTWSGTGSLFHRLRKSTASYTEAAGGDASAQLGHSSKAVTRRYLDPRIVRRVHAVDLIPRPRWDQGLAVEELRSEGLAGVPG